MSLAENIAGELMKRLMPHTADAADSVTATLASALGRLDNLFMQARGTAGLSTLASLLIPAGTPSERSAVDIAERLAACLPVDRAFAAAGTATDRVAREAEGQFDQLRNGSGVPPVRKREQDPLVIVRQLVKALEGAGAEGKAVLGLWRTLHEMSAEVTTFAAIGAPRWTNGDAQRLLREQLQKWIRNLRALGGLPKRTLAVAQEIDAELKFRFSVRLGVAAVLSAGGAVLYGTNEMVDDVKDLVLATGSNAGLGIAVHSRLQRDYRARRAFDVIEQDDRVFGLGQSSLFIGTPLKEATSQSGRDDLLALYIARQSLKVIEGPLPESTPISRLAQMAGWSMRDDNMNLTEARIFEIKPVRGAWLGVIQEMYYRCAFNMWIAVFQDLEAIRGALGKIAGRNISKLNISCETLYAGSGGDWPEVNTSRGGVLTVDARSSSYTVMVTTVDVLPGLVLYWNFELPAAALKLLYDTLRDLFNQLAKRIRRWVVEVYTWVIALVLATVGVLLLLEAAVAGVVELVVAALVRLAPVLTPVLAEIRAFAAALTAAASGWTIATSGDAARGLIALRLVPKGELASDTTLIGVQIGFLRLDDVPVDAAKHLGAVVKAGFALVDYALSPPKIPAVTSVVRS